jgi:peptide/nickel transport system permease protein
MLNVITRRLLIAIPTLVLVSLFVFTLQKLLPGDPALAMAGEERDPQVIAAIRAKLHLDDPLLLQYGIWMSGVLTGDLGISLRTAQPVVTLIGSKLPVTLELASLAMVVALLVGVPAGIVSAVKRGGMMDVGASAVGLFGVSVPNFWLGVLLILVFAVKLKWLPASGFVPFSEDPIQNLRTVALPVLVLSAAPAATLMRQTRAAMIGVMRSDYVRTARAKGLLPRAVILKHAFRNALVPVITLSTLLFGEMLGGAVLTEQVFTIPGFGKLLVDAVFNRDYAVVQGIVLCVATGFILLNLLADVLYVVADPRVRGRA